MKPSPLSYIRLDSGDSRCGVFVGDPLEFKKNFHLRAEFHNKAGPYPEGTYSAFRINFFVPYGNGKECPVGFFPMILEGDKKMSDAIELVVVPNGINCLYEIKRTGSGPGTKYVAECKGPLTQVEIDLVKSKEPYEMAIFE